MKKCSCNKNCVCIHCSCTKYASIFETLGNKNRMKLLLALQERPLTVSELIAQTQLEQTAASHCLRKLEQNKLVTVTREGKFRRYALNTITTKPLLAVMRKHMEAQ